MKYTFYPSNDARSFGFVTPDGSGVCLVYVGGATDADAMSWLHVFLRERFDRIFLETNAVDNRPSLVAFFQTAHADLFVEKARWLRGLTQISVVAAHVRENTVEIANVGTCAAYRVTDAVAERIIPSEGNGGESCYLGAALKVSVEMVKRSLAANASYVFVSKRLDSSTGCTERVVGAMKLAATDAGAAARLLFGEEGGAFGVLETEPFAVELTAEVAMVAAEGLGSDSTEGEIPVGETSGASVNWYRRLREELSGAFQGASTGDVGELADEKVPEFAESPLPRKKKLTTGVLRGAAIFAVVVAAGIGSYAFWEHGGRGWVTGALRASRTGGGAKLAEKSLESSLDLVSIPPGAEVVLDDSMIVPRTPISMVPVVPGTHQIAMKLGDLGEWKGSVVVKAGNMERVRVAFVGEISVNSHPQDGLSVVLDGALKGYTPCVLESIPAGIHVVKVEGKGLSPWEEEVLVTQGGIAEVEVSPGKLPSTGLIQISAGHVSEEGYEESKGRGVFVDGNRAGATPLKVELKPGYHSIKVMGTKGEAPSVNIIQVRPGGKHFVRAEFTGVDPVLVECQKTLVSQSNQVIICVSLGGNTDVEISRVELHLEETDSEREAWETMTRLPGSRSVYAAALPIGFASGGAKTRYFVRATTSEGLEFFSEMGSLVNR